MEHFVYKGLESQLSVVPSMEAEAIVGAATSMRAAVITATKLILIEFIRILLFYI